MNAIAVELRGVPLIARWVIVGAASASVIGVTSLNRMPVDMFPAMNIPVVVVATFY